MDPLEQVFREHVPLEQAYSHVFASAVHSTYERSLKPAALRLLAEQGFVLDDMDPRTPTLILEGIVAVFFTRLFGVPLTVAKVPTQMGYDVSAVRVALLGGASMYFQAKGGKEYVSLDKFEESLANTHRAIMKETGDPGASVLGGSSHFFFVARNLHPAVVSRVNEYCRKGYNIQAYSIEGTGEETRIVPRSPSAYVFIAAHVTETPFFKARMKELADLEARMAAIETFKALADSRGVSAGAERAPAAVASGLTLPIGDTADAEEDEPSASEMYVDRASVSESLDEASLEASPAAPCPARRAPPGPAQVRAGLVPAAEAPRKRRRMEPKRVWTDASGETRRLPPFLYPMSNNPTVIKISYSVLRSKFGKKQDVMVGTISAPTWHEVDVCGILAEKVAERARVIDGEARVAAFDKAHEEGGMQRARFEEAKTAFADLMRQAKGLPIEHRLHFRTM